tara:strand:- start:418 stop:618 length:201 start_codon:yes stop_codon:yes gene_type:complete
MNHNRGLAMVIHAFLFATVCYIFMRFSLKLSQSMSEDRSIALGAIVLLYLILFGTKPPVQLNNNLL